MRWSINEDVKVDILWSYCLFQTIRIKNLLNPQHHEAAWTKKNQVTSRNLLEERITEKVKNLYL